MARTPWKEPPVVQLIHLPTLGLGHARGGKTSIPWY